MAFWFSSSIFISSAASLDGRRVVKLGRRGRLGGGCLGVVLRSEAAVHAAVCGLL